MSEKEKSENNANSSVFHTNSRRQVLTGVAVGAAALATNRSIHAMPEHVENKSIPPLKNPMSLYPTPPFSKQPQPWPGLQSKMQPVPDCGEKTYQGSGRLKGRHALVTGGDSGIGRAAAIAFAREGADVAINYLPQEEPDAKEVIDLIQKAGRKAVALPGDIRNEDFCKKLVADALAKLGQIDILAHVAGRQKYSEQLTDITTEEFDWTMKTNLYALFWITKAAIPHLPPGSSIITTSSLVSYMPPEILVDYGMSKAGISNFTKSMAKQLLPKGIRVNCVDPGPFWTPLQICGAQPQSAIPNFGGESPFKRPGQPAEIAPLYVTLASTESSYVTGQSWGIVGGTGQPG